MDEIPTVAVKSLGQGTCDECYHGFVVMNRPWALLQFIQSRAYVEIEEQFIFVMETVRSRRIISANTLGEVLNLCEPCPSTSRRILPLNISAISRR